MLSLPAVRAAPAPVCAGCVTETSVTISDGLQAAIPRGRRQDIESACVGKLEAQGEEIKGLENLNTRSSESTLTDDGNFRQARNYPRPLLICHRVKTRGRLLGPLLHP